MTGTRVSRGGYWGWIGGLMLVGTVAVFMMITSLVQLKWTQAGFFLLVLVATGMWLRIVQMWRCRDIGWPAFLPWVVFGTIMVASVIGGFSIIASAASGDMEQLAAGMAGASSASMLLSLLDLGFLVLLGCIRGSGQGASFDLEPAGVRVRDSRMSESGDDDDPIARAVANYRRTGSAVPGLGGPARPANPPRVGPSGGRPAGGFGRRAI